jgi:hypothetical protein
MLRGAAATGVAAGLLPPAARVGMAPRGDGPAPFRPLRDESTRGSSRSGAELVRLTDPLLELIVYIAGLPNLDHRPELA